MKKIVGILAVAAMAAGLFAADFSADMYLEGDVATYDASAKSISLLQVKQWAANNSGNHRALTLSVNNDNTGASFGFQDATAVTLGGWSMWYKPTDAVKLSLGNVGSKSVATPHYGDWAGLMSYWPVGLQADITVGSFGSTIILGTGADGYEFVHAGDANTVAGFLADARYTVAGNTIQAYFVKGNGSCNAIPEMSGWCYTTQKYEAGLGLANMGWKVPGYYAEAAVTLADSLEAVLGNVGGQYYVGALGVEGQINMIYAMNDIYYNWYSGAGGDSWGMVEAKGKFEVGADLKVSYGIGSVTPYFRFSGMDVMNKNFTPKVGIDGSLGAISYNAEMQIAISGMKLSTVSVPFYCEIKF